MDSEGMIPERGAWPFPAVRMARRGKPVGTLSQRLIKLCDEAEGLAKGEDGEQLTAMVLTKQIRKILNEST